MDDAVALYPRHVRPSLEAALADTPVVCLLGPRQCGKTTLVRTLGEGREYFNLDEPLYAKMAEEDPLSLLTFTPGPKTIDEVQRVPSLLRTIKMLVDRERRPGQFLLTGSANLLLLPGLFDSLAGRVEYVYLHPLTDAEKARSPGRFLATWLSGKLLSVIKGLGPPMETPTLPERLVAGGFPEPLLRSPERARQWYRQYLAALIERDVRDIARVRDLDQLRQLLEILACQTGTLLNVTALANAVGVERPTLEHFLAILERLFLIRRLHAWHKNDAKRLVKQPKIHLTDSGLMCTLTGLTASDWIKERTRFGHVLESHVIQQIIAQGGTTDSDLRFCHYRDKDQVEVDLVVTRGRDTWGIEVKASATLQPSAGAGLHRLAERCGKSFRGGLVLYAGASMAPLRGPEILAVPLAVTWQL